MWSLTSNPPRFHIIYNAADTIVLKYTSGVHLTAYFGLADIKTSLLDKGFLPDDRDNYGQTPLSWASENGHEAVVPLLLERGAAMDSTDTRGRTPLSLASQNGHETVVRLLLERGAAVDSTDTCGQTPLGCASEQGHEAVEQNLDHP